MTAAGIQFTLNGEQVGLTDCANNLTLLDWLRRRGLTGAKEGCAEGDCGACSVVLREAVEGGVPAYRAVNSCILPVCLLHGREVITVEGVGAAGRLHCVQRKMVEHFGSQCGYCTPGFVMSLFEGYYRGHIQGLEQMQEQLCGNLCRCTGYRPIASAAVEAFLPQKSKDQDPFAQQLRERLEPLGAAHHEFDGGMFVRPTTLAELLRLQKDFPDAQLIAGGTELGLDITKRFKTLPLLLSTEAVGELNRIQATETEWRIGGGASLTEIESKLSAEFPAMRDMLRVFGSRQIRNRATMGGNLVTASPIGDSAPVLLALDARVVLASLDGERCLPLGEFFVGYRSTALRRGEILKTILLPRGASAPGLARRCAFVKVSKRREMDISAVCVCFTLDLDASGTVRHARLAFGGVAPTPIRAIKAEEVLLDRPWTSETLAETLPVLGGEFSPISDVRGSAEYRSGLITGLFEKFFYDQAKSTSSPQPSPPSVGGEGDLPQMEWRYPQDAPPQVAPKANADLSPHESAHLHVTGEALYTDDQASHKTSLEVWPVCAPFARAEILALDTAMASKLPAIRAILTARDIRGQNDTGVVAKDEVLIADREVSFHGQIVALVVGETLEACRAAAEKVIVSYKELPPVLTLREAVAGGSFHNEPNFIRRGDVEQALAAAPERIEGEFELNGQEHFYLEMQAAWAERGEDGSMRVHSSTQHPSEIQKVVAEVLAIPSSRVVVQSPRMGGGFGGKETQAAAPAALAALAAWKTGQRVRVRWNRDQDMILTGHRHPFLARFAVGFDREGHLLATRIHLWSNGGWSLDLSQAVTDRALFHLDNCYYIPAVEFRGQVAKTNLASNTAFRGFGGPQGMLVIEEIMDRVARKLGLPPELVRERNLYRGQGETNTTHYGQEIGGDRISRIWADLKRSSDFELRRAELQEWNRAHPHLKRGLATIPVKFGISFTVTHLNQAGALVLIYQDGSVQVNHGGTEMGQGVHTNIRTIAARALGVTPTRIRVMPTSTDKVPNTSATAASVGTDINGAAVKHACDQLRDRLVPVAQILVQERIGSKPSVENLIFQADYVGLRKHPELRFPFPEVVRRAYLERISLSATGFYATPGIHWNRAEGRGKPFHYFACGAAVAEVEVDRFTGMHRVLRVDILHDAGTAINEGISRGQIEGGFVQGMGWLTTEELKWDELGRLLTHSPDTYKIPSIGDTPAIFNLRLLADAAQKNVVYGTKAVGEPPLMLAIAVREAIRDAVAAFRSSPGAVSLPVPATAEAIWKAIRS